MLFIIGSLVVGVLAALLVPFYFSVTVSQYIAIALLAGIDSIFGGWAASINNNFRLNIFLSGFFGNMLLATALTYLGNLLNVDLYFAAVLIFGTRLFNNFAIIRRFVLGKYSLEGFYKKTG